MPRPQRRSIFQSQEVRFEEVSPRSTCAPTHGICRSDAGVLPLSPSGRGRAPGNLG
jgi:hypothetical protein